MITINREEEQMVREAAKQVNIWLNEYRERYKDIDRKIYGSSYQFSLGKAQTETT